MNELSKKTRQKLTKDQRMQLIDVIKKLMSVGTYTYDIKIVISKKYGLSQRSVERYITRARKEMVDYFKKPVEQFRAESYCFYRSVLKDPRSTQGERLRARERLDKLLGLDTCIQTHNQSVDYSYMDEEIKNMSDAELEQECKKIFNE